MTLWLDAHLSPLLAPWIEAECGFVCVPFRNLGFASEADRTIFLAARSANAIIVSKDRDFVDWQALLGAPPKILWLHCGNQTNDQLRRLLSLTLGDALVLLDTEDLVEIMAP